MRHAYPHLVLVLAIRVNNSEQRVLWNALSALVKRKESRQMAFSIIVHIIQLSAHVLLIA